MKRAALVFFVGWFFVLGSCSQKESGPSMSGTGADLPPVQVIARTDKTRATVSQSIRYTLRVTYVPDITVTLPEPGAKIANLRITDFGENGPTETEDRLYYEKWFKLQPDIAGTYIIPSMTVAYAEKNGTKKTLKTPQIFLEVTSALTHADGEKSTDIIDIKPLEKMERDLTPFILAGCAAAALVALVAGIFLYVRRRQKKRAKNRRPAHEIALEEIEKLDRDGLIEQGTFREHYFRLSDIFRTYIENRFNIPAVELTTPELIPEIRKLEKMDASAQSRAEDFLAYSDLVKFAKYTPGPEEISANRDKVVSIISETREAPKEEQ